MAEEGHPEEHLLGRDHELLAHLDLVRIFQLVCPRGVDVHGHIVIEPLPFSAWYQVRILDTVLKLSNAAVAVTIWS